MTGGGLPRAVLALAAAVFGAAGALFLLHPAVVALAGIELTTATARNDVRAVYGGLERFIIRSRAQKRHSTPALTCRRSGLVRKPL